MKLLQLILFFISFVLSCSDSIDKISVSGTDSSSAGAMAVINENLCTKCERCYGVCPRPGKALSKMVVNGGETIFVIDPQQCLRCGLCISKCPYGAITWKH
ncbi:MAG TPA: ferredoxin family protein [Chitinispirillaceae bacterium]|nr:ferredoxin family protein [Chitinispirillaceae bacterium]